MNRLTKSLSGIITNIGQQKTEETRAQLALITKMKEDARYFSTMPAKKPGTQEEVN